MADFFYREKRTIEGVEQSLLKRSVHEDMITQQQQASDHGSLSGLLDNDHPQYALSATVFQRLTDIREDFREDIASINQLLFEQEGIDVDLTAIGNARSIVGIDVQREAIPGTVMYYNGDELVWTNINDIILLEQDETEVDLSGIEDRLSAVEADLSVAQSDISTLQSDLSTVESQVQVNTTDISEILDWENNFKSKLIHFDFNFLNSGVYPGFPHISHGLQWEGHSGIPKGFYGIDVGNLGSDTGYTYGDVDSGFGMRFTMSSNAGRGWVFATVGPGFNPVASISNQGQLALKSGITFVATEPRIDTSGTVSDSKHNYALIYDSGTSAITLQQQSGTGGTPAAGSGWNPETEVFEWDDFINAGGTNQGEWGKLGWKGSGTWATELGEPDHPGVCSINTSSAYLYGTTSPSIGSISGATGFTEIVWVVKFQGGDVAGEDLYAGLSENWTSAGINDGVFFTNRPGGAGLNWSAETQNGGSSTRTDTGIAFAVDTWYTFRIVNDAGTIKFYLNDALVATHTTDIPNSTDLVPGAASLCGTSHKLYVDYFSIKMPVPSGRESGSAGIGTLGGTGGTSDHGLLDGLLDASDHPQYVLTGTGLMAQGAIEGILTVSGNVRARGDIFVNYGGPEGDAFLYFHNAGFDSGEHLKWDETDERFEFSDDLEVGGDLLATNLQSTQNMFVNVDGPDGDSSVYFYDGASATGQRLYWNDSPGVHQ